MTTTTITPEQYACICDVIDRVKMDDRQEDTDAYASDVLHVLNVTVEDPYDRAPRYDAEKVR